MPHSKKKYNIRVHKYINGVFTPSMHPVEDELEEVIKFAECKLIELVAESYKIFDELGALIHQSVGPAPVYCY